MSKLWQVVVLLFLAALAAACEPAIGDECSTATDCPSGSTCDTSVPDGYCLEVGCDDNSDCPSEAVCVFFDNYLSYCLAKCDGDGDCRDGHVCRTDVGDARFCFLPVEQGELPFARATD